MRKGVTKYTAQETDRGRTGDDVNWIGPIHVDQTDQRSQNRQCFWLKMRENDFANSLRRNRLLQRQNLKHVRILSQMNAIVMLDVRKEAAKGSDGTSMRTVASRVAPFRR